MSQSTTARTVEYYSNPDGLTLAYLVAGVSGFCWQRKQLRSQGSSGKRSLGNIRLLPGIFTAANQPRISLDADRIPRGAQIFGVCISGGIVAI